MRKRITVIMYTIPGNEIIANLDEARANGWVTCRTAELAFSSQMPCDERHTKH
jgi:hypothetical protein